MLSLISDRQMSLKGSIKRLAMFLLKKWQTMSVRAIHACHQKYFYSRGADFNCYHYSKYQLGPFNTTQKCQLHSRQIEEAMKRLAFSVHDSCCDWQVGEIVSTPLSKEGTHKSGDHSTITRHIFSST